VKPGTVGCTNSRTIVLYFAIPPWPSSALIEIAARLGLDGTELGGAGGHQ
jgi:hypothetical protein